MKSLFPHDRIKSAFCVDYATLHKAGIKAVFFDIDNTLVPHDAPADDAARGLISEIRAAGLMVYIISNNDEPRVKSFSDDVGCSGYIYKAKKPSSEGFDKAMTYLALKKDEVIYFGDQIFTDVAGGRNAGIWTVLTKQINHREPFHIHLKRIAELPILLVYFIVKSIKGPQKGAPLKKA